MPFIARPRLDNNIVVQNSTDSLTLNGTTNFLGTLLSKGIEINASLAYATGGTTTYALTLIDGMIRLAPTVEIGNYLPIITFAAYTGQTSIILSAKVDKYTGATSGDIAIFTTNGDLTDNGNKVVSSIGSSITATNLNIGSELAVRNAINQALGSPIVIVGSWNPRTNIPNLTGITTGQTGHAWIVTTGGTTCLGGICNWEINDIAVKISGSSNWIKINNSSVSALWGNIQGNILNQIDLQNEFNTKLNISSYIVYTGNTKTTLTNFQNEINFVSGKTITAGKNLGGNIPIYINNSGNTLNFRTLKASGGTNIITQGNAITIDSPIVNGVYLPISVFTGYTGNTNSNGQQIVKKIIQTSHGFMLGNVIGWDNGINKYRTVVSNIGETIEPLGIVSEIIDTNTFRITYAGYISNISGIIDTNSHNISGSTVYFISPTITGGLTPTEPIAPTQISRPILITETNNDGVVVQYRGAMYGTGSTSGSTGPSFTLSNVGIGTGEIFESFVFDNINLRTLIASGTTKIITDGDNVIVYTPSGGTNISSAPNEIIFNNAGILTGNTNLLYYPAIDALQVNNGSSVGAGSSVAMAGGSTYSGATASVAIAGGNTYAQNSVAMAGGNTYAQNSVAMAGGTVFGQYSIAMGSGSQAQGYGSIAIGNSSSAYGFGSVAFPYSLTQPDGTGSIAMANGVSDGQFSVAMAGGTTYSGATNSVAMGDNSSTNSFNSLVFGYGNILNSGNTYSALIGGNFITIPNNTYLSTTIVPNLAIWNTPQGSGNFLSWNPLTKMVVLASGSTGGGISQLTFNTYTGNTQTKLNALQNDVNYISGKTLTKSTFNTYTGNTQTTLNALQNDVNYISGKTNSNYNTLLNDINFISGKTLTKSTFNTYTGNTNIILNSLQTEINFISGKTYGNSNSIIFLSGKTQTIINNLSTDVTMGGGSPSNSLYPSQAAVNTFVNNELVTNNFLALAAIAMSS